LTKKLGHLLNIFAFQGALIQEKNQILFHGICVLWKIPIWKWGC